MYMYFDLNSTILEKINAITAKKTIYNKILSHYIICRYKKQKLIKKQQ